MSEFSAFESLVASESEGKIAKQAASDKLAAAIYDVREQYGAHLFCAKSKEEFGDRLALCKDDMMKTVNAHLMPVTGVMRRVCKTMEREWREKIANEDPNQEWDTQQLQEDFEVKGFQAPFVVVVRKADGQLGSLEFNRGSGPGNPRRYRNFVPHEASRRTADFGPDQSLDQTFSPSDDELIPEGDFHGYKDSVDQDAPALIDRDFTPGGDSGKQARRQAADDPSTKVDWQAVEEHRRRQKREQSQRELDEIPRRAEQSAAQFGDHTQLEDVPDYVAGWEVPVVTRDTGDYKGKHRSEAPPSYVHRGDEHERKERRRKQTMEYEREARRRRANEMMGYPEGSPTDASGMAVPTADPAAAPPPPGTGGSGIPGTGSGAVTVARRRYAEEGDMGDLNPYQPSGVEVGGAIGIDSPGMNEHGEPLPPITGAVIKRYAQWCLDNLARPGERTLEYYAANRPDREYFILQAALQHARRRSDRRTAAGKDYLTQADEAITNLLNEKAEEFQESIQPLQQALQTIQYAEQVQQAQNPMGVMPPAGTVNVLPQSQGPQGAPPPGVDPSTGQVDPAMLQQLMGQGGMDPSMGGGAPPQGDPSGGIPPAAVDQGAIPPELAQQMQAARLRSAADERRFLDGDWNPGEEKYNFSQGPRPDAKNKHVDYDENYSGKQWDRESAPEGKWFNKKKLEDGEYKGKHRAAAFGEDIEPNEIGHGGTDYERYNPRNLGVTKDDGAEWMGVDPELIEELARRGYSEEAEFNPGGKGSRGQHEQGGIKDNQDYEGRHRANRGGYPKGEAPPRGRTAKDSGCTCWEGYERVPGTEPCASGSCRKKARRTAAEDLGNCQMACGKPAEGTLDLRILGPTPFCKACAERYLTVKKRNQGPGHPGPGKFHEAGILDEWYDWQTQRAQRGQLGVGGDKDLEDFAKELGIGSRGLSMLRRQLFGSRKEAWTGWGPSLAAKQHAAPGWEWDKRLSAYVATDVPESFNCKCGAKLEVPGYHNCKCGKIWNSYVIGTGGENRQAAAEKFLCREVPVRENVIMASRKESGKDCCPACSKHIRDYDLSGCEDHCGQRWCLEHLPPKIKEQMKNASRADDEDEDYASDDFPSDHHPDTGKSLKSTPKDWHHRDKNQRWTARRG